MILLLALLTFYVQTWEEYHTQTLTLGIISGPVEGILVLCAVYAATAYLGGGHFWQLSLLQSVGVDETSSIPDLIYNMSWNEWYMVYGGVVLVFNTGQRFVYQWIVYTIRSDANAALRSTASPTSCQHVNLVGRTQWPL